MSKRSFRTFKVLSILLLLFVIFLVSCPPLLKTKMAAGKLKLLDHISYGTNTFTQRTNSLLAFLWDSLPQRSPTEEHMILSFGVVSDIHVKPSDKRAQKNFSNMLQDVSNNLRASALVIAGDLGNGTPQDYATVRRLVGAKSKHPPLYFTIGNHEFYQAYHTQRTGAWSPNTFPNGCTDRSAINRFTSFIGKNQVYYDEYILGYHFIFLGSEASAMTSSKYLNKAYLSQKQLNWLQTKLKGATQRPTFVFLHQPLPNTTSGTYGGSKSSYVVQAQQFKQILAQHPEVILFTGHTHYQLGLSDNVYRKGFTSVNVSSVALPKSSSGKSLKACSEGVIVEVYKSHIVVKGRDFSHSSWISSLSYNIKISND